MITIRTEHNLHEDNDISAYVVCASIQPAYKIYFFFFWYNELRRVWNIHRRGVSSSKIKENFDEEKEPEPARA